MSNYSTHKRTSSSKRETLARREVRRVKYGTASNGAAGRQGGRR